MILPDRACRRHRPVLVALVDRGERTPATIVALDHLEVCRPCEREVTDLALTIAALRRAGSTLRAVEMPAVTPERVARLAVASRHRSGDRWAWRFQVGSLLAGAALVGVLVAPRVGIMPPQAPSATDAPTHVTVPAAPWRSAEARLATTPDQRPDAPTGSLPPRYPDGLNRPWKEVPPTDASPRELEPR